MMDDILVHGRTKEEHDTRLTEVLQRLQGTGITLNKESVSSQKQVSNFGGMLLIQMVFNQLQTK